MPLAISRQFLRCFDVASRRRGNHSSGMDISRPSESTTLSASCVTRTLSASTAVGQDTLKVFVPFLQKESNVFLDDFSNLPKFFRIITQLQLTPHRQSSSPWDFQMNLENYYLHTTIQRWPRAVSPEPRLFNWSSSAMGMPYFSAR